jgi:hypothetical protein
LVEVKVGFIEGGLTRVELTRLGVEWTSHEGIIAYDSLVFLVSVLILNLVKNSLKRKNERELVSPLINLISKSKFWNYSLQFSKNMFW